MIIRPYVRAEQEGAHRRCAPSCCFVGRSCWLGLQPHPTLLLPVLGKGLCQSFASRWSAAAVSAFTPARMVGSGSGAKSGE